MKKMTHLFFTIIFFCILFSFIKCNAKIVDNKGSILPEVFIIFRKYSHLIVEKKLDIHQRYGLSSEVIDTILNPESTISNISLTDLNAIAQTVFLRPAFTERKDISTWGSTFLKYTDEHVLKAFQSIGDINNKYPKETSYTYIFLNGSTVQNMRYRIQTLINFIESNKLQITPTTEIVFLTGDRNLFDFEDENILLNPFPLSLNENWQKPIDLPKNEYDAAKLVWEQSLLPKNLRNAKITFVNADKKKMFNPDTNEIIEVRPTTYDTIQKWAEESTAKPGKCLSISNQPYVYYQEMTIYGCFKKMGLIEKGFTIEGSGTLDNSKDLYDFFKKNIAVILDNFARTIYTELHNL